MIKVNLPELGEGIKKATVSYWFFKVGEKVNKDDDLVELTTDKSTFNLPSPSQGVIEDILVSEGEEAQIGEVLGVIQES